MRHSLRAVSLSWLIVLVPILGGSPAGADGNGRVPSNDARSCNLPNCAAARAGKKAPIAKNDAATTAVDTSVTIDVTANDRGRIARKTVSIVGAGPRHGRARVKRRNGKVIYTPNPGFSGQDKFKYRVEDNRGALSNKARVRVTVGTPVANNDTAATAIDTPVVINVVANDTAPDGNLDPQSVAIATNPASGGLVNHFDGTVTYTPSAGFFGTDDFAYTVNDGQGAASNVATVTVTVGPVADAGPDRNDVTGQSVTLNGSASFDPDGNTLAFSWRFLSVPSASARTSADIVDPASPMPSFTPDVDGDYELELTVTDGTLSDTDRVVITTAAPGRVPPNAAAGPDIVVQLGQTVTLNGSASDDPDHLPNPTLTFQWTFVSTPTGSTLTNGNITPTTATASFIPDVPGVYLLRLDAFDGADTDSDQVMVTVQPLPPPVITSITNDNTPTVSGTAATGIIEVTLYENGTPVPVPPAVSLMNGAWSYTYTTAVLPEGVYTFTATGKNAAGQESSPSAAKTVMVDATGPTAPSFIQENCGGGEATVSSSQFDDLPVLVSIFCLFVDGGEPVRAVVQRLDSNDNKTDEPHTYPFRGPFRDDDGIIFFRIEITDRLGFVPGSKVPPGKYHLKLFVSDVAGNESCVASFVSLPEDRGCTVNVDSLTNVPTLPVFLVIQE
jgi:hypothetical protein